MKRSIQTMMAAAFLCVAAGSGLAQQDAKSDRLIRRPAQSPVERSQASSQVVIRSVENGDTVEIRIADGQISAKVNGERVPADRVIQTPDEIQILGKDGSVERSIPFSQAGGAEASTALPPVQGNWLGSEPPKVMIGITMSNESGGGVRIDSVLDSLPAAKAGLRAGEVIWSIDGDTIDNEAELRELLRGKEPGDKLKVKVKQEDGEFREVILKLEAFDPDRMAVRTRTLEGSAFGPDPLLDSHERIMENLRRSLEQVEGIKESDMARIQEEVRRAFDMRSRYGDVVAIAPRAGGLARVPRAGGGGGTPPLTFAPMSNVQNEEVIKKLESVLKKLERVEKRLEEIEKKLGAGNQRQ
jgi:hypothetical protein